MRKIGAFLCFLVAAAAVIFAVVAWGSKSSFFIGLAIFRVVKDGSFMGMIGNIFGILVTAVGYAAVGFYALIKKDDKMTLYWSGGMTVLGIISLIVAIFSGFTLGDIIIIVPCAMVLLSLFFGKDSVK